MAATLAAAQKLATSEDTAPAEEDEDEVWLRALDSRDWWGRWQMRDYTDPIVCTNKPSETDSFVHFTEKKLGQQHPDKQS